MGSNISQKLLEATVLTLSSLTLLSVVEISQHLHDHFYLHRWRTTFSREEGWKKRGKEREGSREGEELWGEGIAFNLLSYQNWRTWDQLINWFQLYLSCSFHLKKIKCTYNFNIRNPSNDKFYSVKIWLKLRDMQFNHILIIYL